MSDDEKVNNPSHYTSHASGIACIEIVEHLPSNFAAAIGYIWRHGLKSSETALIDLKKARWYTEREAERYRLFELDATDWYKGTAKTDVVWRALAQRVVDKEGDESLLSCYLDALLSEDSHESMLEMIDEEISDLETSSESGVLSKEERRQKIENMKLQMSVLRSEVFDLELEERREQQTEELSVNPDHLECRLGANLETFAADLIYHAKRLNRDIGGTFNDIRIVASVDMTTDELMDQFYRR